MLDRMHAGTRIAVVTGPIDLPDPDTAGERLAAFARLGPATRIALRPEPDGRRWVHVPDAMPGAVAVADAPSDPRDLLRSACARTPFQVTLAGDYLLTEHDHGIGEIQLALYAMLVVTGALDSAPGLSRSLSRRDDGLVSAAVRVFGSDPRRVRAVLKILEQLPDPVDDGVPDVPATPAGSAGTSVEAVRLDAATVAGVRRWRDAAGVAASLKTLLLCGVVRALDDAGLALHPDIVVPVDLRRYLRTGVNPLGNFVAGLRFRHRAGDDPERLQRALSETIESGRPVASAVRSASAVALQRYRRTGHEEAAGGTLPRLLFSGINEMAPLRALGWRDPAAGALYGRVDPIGPADLTLGTVGVHGAVTLSVSFHPDRHPAGVISAALQRFAADPTSHFQ